MNADKSSTEPKHGVPRARSRRRTSLYAVLGTLGLLAIIGGCGALYIAHLWRSVPDHWQTYQTAHQAQAPAMRRAMGENVQKRVINQLGARHKIGDEGQIEITTQEINAWLTEQFPLWAANQKIKLPHELKQIMVATEDQQILIAAHVQSPDFNQIISARLAPQLLDDGTMRVRLISIYAGKLPLPANFIRDQLANHVKKDDLEKFEPIENMLLEGQSFPVPIRSANKRQTLRLTSLQITPSGLSVQYVVEPRKKK